MTAADVVGAISLLIVVGAVVGLLLMTRSPRDRRAERERLRRTLTERPVRRRRR